MPDPEAAVPRIGLTGGIASGKSTVAEMFAELGVPVIDTDVIARQVAAPGEPALAEIVEAFGPDLLQADGSLDRRALRARVFADPADRHRLEGILHPRIRARTLATAARAGGPYQVIVVPLLVESGFTRLVDEVVVVDCPEAEQRRRLLARDGGDAAQADRMMAAQLSREARLAAADTVIDNGGELSETRAQVHALHRRYLEIARDARAD
ncbi:MAG: dephospho-CoA kinase [Chromatiales bacterium]|nr:MAG: dephospho-CoA kinase [Chromatiales bacterium]